MQRIACTHVPLFPARPLSSLVSVYEQCEGTDVNPLRVQRACAASRRSQQATQGALPRCCDERMHCQQPAVSSIYQTQDQCPSLASARAVGGGTPLGLGGLQPPLDDSEGAWTHFKPSPPIPTPSITASDPHFLSSILATAGPQVPLRGAQP
jgi:hypothetical protein